MTALLDASFSSFDRNFRRWTALDEAIATKHPGITKLLYTHAYAYKKRRMKEKKAQMLVTCNELPNYSVKVHPGSSFHDAICNLCFHVGPCICLAAYTALQRLQRLHNVNVIQHQQEAHDSSNFPLTFSCDACDTRGGVKRGGGGCCMTQICPCTCVLTQSKTSVCLSYGCIYVATLAVTLATICLCSSHFRSLFYMAQVGGLYCHFDLLWACSPGLWFTLQVSWQLCSNVFGLVLRRYAPSDTYQVCKPSIIPFQASHHVVFCERMCTS